MWICPATSKVVVQVVSRLHQRTCEIERGCEDRALDILIRLRSRLCSVDLLWRKDEVVKKDCMIFQLK